MNYEFFLKFEIMIFLRRIYAILEIEKSEKMKIGIASDHKGFEMKKELLSFLKQSGYEIMDYGTNSEESVDYPDYAHKLCEALLEGKIEFGIAICYTGIGMSIACNKEKGIRAAKVCTKKEAELTREHNDANVLVLSAMMDIEKVKEIVTVFFETKFSNEERHLRRIGKLES